MNPKQTSTIPPNDAGVVATGASPHARLRAVPIRAVTLRDGFWRRRIESNYRAGIPAFVRWLDRDEQREPFPTFARTSDSGAIGDAIDALHRNITGRNSHRLVHSWRASVQVLLEACALTLQSTDTPEIRSLTDELAKGVVSAHDHPDFFGAYYGENFEMSYQFGLPGHAIQAAVAHHRTTGRTELLDTLRRVADQIVEKFGHRRAIDHPCIEMALVELYRTTGDSKYLETAGNFLQALMDQPPLIGQGCGDYEYQETEPHFGRHVVRQTYLCAGGADYYLETGDAAFWEKVQAMWQDMVTGKSHITGRLAIEYAMPERIAAKPYELWVGVFRILQDHIVRGGELCESVGNLYWNWRMLAAHGEAQYADYFERVLYNSFLAHVSLDGSGFFYVCPHATDGDFPTRTAWSHPETSCCSPNALRMIAGVPGYFFSTSDDGIWIHLYDACDLNWQLPMGLPVELSVDTRYPWDGLVEIDVSPESDTEFSLYLRIPAWCTGAFVQINGEPADEEAVPGQYLEIRRTWKKRDRVRLHLAMPVQEVGVDHRAAEFEGKVALMRGPLVYCFESVDQPDREAWDIQIPRNPDAKEHSGTSLYEVLGESAAFHPVFHEELLGGVTALHGRDQPVTAVPYYAWANRGPCAMRVWVDRSK